MSVGILLGYVFGDIMDFTTSALCLLMITNIFLAGVIIIHDSPMYLLRKSRFRVRRNNIDRVLCVSGIHFSEPLENFDLSTFLDIPDVSGYISLIRILYLLIYFPFPLATDSVPRMPSNSIAAQRETRRA